MVQITPLDRSHLPQVLALVNSHLSTVIPGWSLTADYFWERLQSEPQEYITDPWVVERKSIVGIVRIAFARRRISADTATTRAGRELERLLGSCSGPKSAKLARRL